MELGAGALFYLSIYLSGSLPLRGEGWGGGMRRCGACHAKRQTSRLDHEPPILVQLVNVVPRIASGSHGKSHCPTCFRPPNSLVYKRNVPAGIVTKHEPWEVPHRKEPPTARVFCWGNRKMRRETGSPEAAEPNRTGPACGQNSHVFCPGGQTPSARIFEFRSARCGQNCRVLSVQTCFTARAKSRSHFGTRNPQPLTRNSPPTQRSADGLHRNPNHAKAIGPPDGA
jgi:hypothetical protein